jgi:hypothetical protein
MACSECGSLSTHVFRGPDDLIHALRLAAEEMDRGVLARVEERKGPGGAVHYRFRCAQCGDRFTLTGDMSQGSGGWTREKDSQEDQP